MLRVHPGVGTLDRNFRISINDGSQNRLLGAHEEQLHDDILHGSVQGKKFLGLSPITPHFVRSFFLQIDASGCSSSWVRLVRTDRGPVGSFSCENEVIYVEPANLHIRNAPVHSSLVYRCANLSASHEAAHSIAVLV